MFRLFHRMFVYKQNYIIFLFLFYLYQCKGVFSVKKRRSEKSISEKESTFVLDMPPHSTIVIKTRSEAPYVLNVLKGTCRLEGLWDVYRGYFEGLAPYGIAFWGTYIIVLELGFQLPQIIKRMFVLPWSHPCRYSFFWHKLLTVPSIYIYSPLTLITNNLHLL